MRIHCAKKSEKGVTLVDVCMAIAVLGVMAGSVMGSFRYGLFVMQLARENQRATQIMLAKIETMRLFNWDQINARPIPYTFSFSDVYDPQAASAAQKGVTYVGTVGVSNCPLSSSSKPKMRQVTVSLQWTTKGRVAHSRSISTFIARDGIQNYVY
jgi:hypothetical protein